MGPSGANPKQALGRILKAEGTRTTGSGDVTKTAP